MRKIDHFSDLSSPCIWREKKRAALFLRSDTLLHEFGRSIRNAQYAAAGLRLDPSPSEGALRPEPKS